MKSGTRAAQHLHKLKKFEFGAISPSTIPDFCVDPDIWWPDQDQDGAPTECVGYTNADYLCDTFGQVFSPDFNYAATRYICGEGAGVEGTSFHAGPEALIMFGGLLASKANDTAATKGELYVSDFAHWTEEQKTAARTLVQNGLRGVLQGGDPFDEIILAAYQTGKGISVGSPWSMAFNAAPNGIGPLPVFNGVYDLWHNYAIKGKNTINGIEYAMVKSWQGRGWRYFDRQTLHILMNVTGAGALAIDPSAWRMAAVAGIIIRRSPQLIGEIKQLVSLS